MEQAVEAKEHRGGKPRKPVDKELIYKLAAIHCTNKEIASICGIHIDSLQRLYKDIIQAGKESGKSRLRRKMWEQALQGNVTMMIWLSKNHLGMTDNVLVSEDKRPLPWTDDEEIPQQKTEDPTQADTIVYTEVHEDLDQLSADLKGI
jgi:ABC-type tungstate transport system permease subunit